MSGLETAALVVGLVLPFIVALVVAVALASIAARSPRPRATNHAGRELPVTLGVALFVAAAVGPALGGVGAATWQVHVALLVVFGAGLLDDLAGGGPRGLGGHLRALGRGEPTTGALKVVAAVAAAALAVWGLGGSVPRAALGVLFVAGATNLWNVLDVRPGRALKVFVPLQAALIAPLWPSALAVAVAGFLGAALGVGWFDLRERAMLGDAGSNVLGFAVGVALYAVLPLGGLVLALVAVLALQLAAETVTISRLIDAVPPLRWYDRLGRRPTANAAQREVPGPPA